MSPAAGPWLQGLPAQLGDECRVLVLGSMPGEASLEAARYYAHPRNRFWPLMGQLCGFDATLDYPQRLAALQQAGIGLWDVIGRCRRRGSLDTAILDEVANDLPGLLARLPQLQAIAFNGGKAAQSFRRHVEPALDPARRDGLAWHALPSTSPANAGFSHDRLLAQWQVLAPWLRHP
jgi:double-stranded uracil-DNA glycosylase